METSSSSPSTEKRHRISRACDQCRQKKIRCDGTQPCSQCTDYSYECTYDQPSNRGRKSTPKHISAELSSSTSVHTPAESSSYPSILKRPGQQQVKTGKVLNLAEASSFPSVHKSLGQEQGKVPTPAEASLSSFTHKPLEQQQAKTGKVDTPPEASSNPFTYKSLEQQQIEMDKDPTPAAPSSSTSIHPAAEPEQVEMGGVSTPAEPSSSTSIHPAIEQQQVNMGNDDSHSISSLSDNDEDFGLSDIDIEYLSDSEAENQPKAKPKAKHMSYLDQMKYFDKHQEPPVLKDTSTDFYNRLLIENAKKTPAGREKLRQLKAKKRALNTPAGNDATPAGNDATPAGNDATPAGNDATPDPLVVDFPNLKLTKLSKKFKLENMSRDKFWKHVNTFLEKSADEDELLQPNPLSAADQQNYAEVLDILKEAEKKLPAFDKHLERLEKGEVEVDAPIPETPETPPIRIPKYNEADFPDTDYLDKTFEEGEFDALLDDFYDNEQMQDVEDGPLGTLFEDIEHVPKKRRI